MQISGPPLTSVEQQQLAPTEHLALCVECPAQTMMTKVLFHQMSSANYLIYTVAIFVSVIWTLREVLNYN